MTLSERIAAQQTALRAHIATRETMTNGLEALRARVDASDATVTDAMVTEAIDARQAHDLIIRAVSEQIETFQTELAADEATAALQRSATPAGAPATNQRTAPGEREAGATRGAQGYDNQARATNVVTAYNRRANLASGESFFVDAYASTRGNAGRDARERLERNEQETRAIAEAQGSIQRATTTGSYAGLVVPQYLVDMAANVLRNGRPMADACTHLPLPDGGMQFLLPVASTGVTAASQATENTAASNTNQVWGNVTIPVASIMGQQQISRQSLERGTPGIDSIVYMDLAAAYMAELDRQIFAGTGSSAQLSGILATSGIYKATAYGAAVAVASFYSKTAGAIAGIAGAGTAVTPSYIAMHPRRWGWLTLQVDSSNRPLVVPNQNGPYNAYGLNVDPGGYGGDGDITGGNGPRIVGTMQGLPVFTDANIPVNLGVNTNEDTEIIFDPRMALLFEDGDGMPRQLTFEQIQVTGVAGFGATVTLAAYNYAAFTAGRYPAAFGQVGGLETVATTTFGQVAPTY